MDGSLYSLAPQVAERHALWRGLGWASLMGAGFWVAVGGLWLAI